MADCVFEHRWVITMADGTEIVWAVYVMPYGYQPYVELPRLRFPETWRYECKDVTPPRAPAEFAESCHG